MLNFEIIEDVNIYAILLEEEKLYGKEPPYTCPTIDKVLKGLDTCDTFLSKIECGDLRSDVVAEFLNIISLSPAKINSFDSVNDVIDFIDGCKNEIQNNMYFNREASDIRKTIEEMNKQMQTLREANETLRSMRDYWKETAELIIELANGIQ